MWLLTVDPLTAKGRFSFGRIRLFDGKRENFVFLLRSCRNLTLRTQTRLLDGGGSSSLRSGSYISRSRLDRLTAEVGCLSSHFIFFFLSETLCFLSRPLSLYLSLSLSLTKLQAYIRVLDMNEHRPVFLKPLYEVRVPLCSPLNGRVQLKERASSIKKLQSFMLHYYITCYVM